MTFLLWGIFVYLLVQLIIGWWVSRYIKKD